MIEEEHPKKTFAQRVTGALKVGTAAAVAGGIGGAIAGRLTAGIGAGIGLDAEAIGELAEAIFNNSEGLTNSIQETIALENQSSLAIEFDKTNETLEIAKGSLAGQYIIPTIATDGLTTVEELSNAISGMVRNTNTLIGAAGGSILSGGAGAMVGTNGSKVKNVLEGRQTGNEEFDRAI